MAHPVLQSLTAASGVLLQWTLSSLATRGTAMKKQTPQLNPQNIYEKQPVLVTGNGNNRSNKQQSTAMAGEGYCTEETHSRPLTHSQSHQAQTTTEHLRVKQKQAWTKEERKGVIWCYMYCRQHFAGNYKKMYEIWRQRNPDSRMYLDAKKLLNQKNYITKHKKLTENEIEEIKKDVQANEEGHLGGREGEEGEHHVPTVDEEWKRSVVSTSEGTTDTRVHRDQTRRLKGKIECAYYQVTQLTMDDRPRLQKLQNMFKMKLIMRTANDAVREILCERDFDVTELNHLIYAAATVITEEINGRKEYKLQTQRLHTPPWIRRIQNTINDMRKKQVMHTGEACWIKDGDQPQPNMERKQ